MKAPFYTIYAVYGGGDERRSPDTLVGYFSKQGDAFIASRGIGWYGGEGLVLEKVALNVDGKVYVLADPDPIDLDNNQAKADEALHAKVMAKLTDEEIRVLRKLGVGQDK